MRLRKADERNCNAKWPARDFTLWKFYTVSVYELIFIAN